MENHSLVDLIAIVMAMMMVIFYYRGSIKGFFEDGRYLLVSCVVLVALFFVFYVYFSGFILARD